MKFRGLKEKVIKWRKEMPILSIFDLEPEVVFCFRKFLKERYRNPSIDFHIKNGPRVPSSEFFKYNQITISNDADFSDRFHLTYFMEPNSKNIPNREFILDVNPFMMYCGFMYLYSWFMWFYTFIF